jgi:hypothetical protein
MNKIAKMIALLAVGVVLPLLPVPVNADVVIDDFESGVGSWQHGTFSGWASGSITTVTNPVAGGTYAGDLYYDLKLPDNTAYVWIKMYSANTAGGTFSMWVYGNNSGNRLMIEWGDGITHYAYRRAQHDFVPSPYWDNFIDWTGWEHFTAPVPSDKLARLNIFISDYNGLPASKGDIYIDDIKVISASPFNLSQGWSMFSPGGYGSITWSAVAVYNDNSGETKSIVDAEGAGWIQGTIYYFDSGTGLFKTVPGDGDNLDWYRSYLIYSSLNNLTLRLQ